MHGAWLSYGLGTLNENLPTFRGPAGSSRHASGGSNNWTSDFFPPSSGRCISNSIERTSAGLKTPESISSDHRLADMNSLATMNLILRTTIRVTNAFCRATQVYELAAKMQSSIPEATNLESETRATQACMPE